MKNKISFSIFLLFINIVCISQNIDSIVNSKPKTLDELENIARELIYNEVTAETPDIGKIKSYQNYLNGNKNFGLYPDENLMLYYFIQDWHNVFDQIMLCRRSAITGRGHNTARDLTKVLFEKIDKNNILDRVVYHCMLFQFQKLQPPNYQTNTKDILQKTRGVFPLVFIFAHNKTHKTRYFTA
jgi:hypothetical protein